MGKISRRHFVQGTGAGLLAAKAIAPLQAQPAAPPGKVKERGNEVVIDGSITLSELAENPLIRERYTALAEAAGAVGTPRIRNARTLAEHFPKIAPALVALDAKFKIDEPWGDVRLPGYKGWTFYTPYSTSTGGNTLRSKYHKGVAVALEMDRGICKQARIVLGGVALGRAAPIPRRVPQVEALLEGKRLTPKLAAQAGQAVAEDKRTQGMVKRAVAALGSVT
jgi:CO/xanthine dehydrogenase FAD-binding subunit